MRMNLKTRLGLAGAGLLATGGLLTLGLAGPAMAQGCTSNQSGATGACSSPVTVTTTVQSYSETLTLSTSAIAFGSVVGGQPVTPVTEAWTVAGNDPSGFTLEVVTNGVNQLNGTGSHQIADSDLTLNGAPLNTGNPGVIVVNPDYTSTPLSNTDGSVTTPGSAAGTDSWGLTVPAATPPDTYTQTLNYELIGS